MSKVVIVSGTIGAGKTSISKSLQYSLGIDKEPWARIEGDFFLGIGTTVKETIKWEGMLEFSWGSILETAKLLLEKGVNVIIDFVIEEEMPRILHFFKEMGEKKPQLHYVLLKSEK